MTHNTRLAGVELYFEDLHAAKKFYRDLLGLALEEDDPNHHAKFTLGKRFVCLERKGVEDYASAHKAVLFLEVPDLNQALNQLDPEDLVGSDSSAARPWAAVGNPEGHTVVFLESPERGPRPNRRIRRTRRQRRGRKQRKSRGG